MLKITHSSGFFSCCSMKLFKVINYFNKNGILPESVDSSEQFKLYKPIDMSGCDITYEYFKHYDQHTDIPIPQFTKNIDYEQTYQYVDYKKLKFNDIIPFVQKYFTPTDTILNLATSIEKKYEFDYSNTCVLFYRGNDKIKEIQLGKYDDFIIRADKILNLNPDIKFLIQSDETEFIETILAKFPLNSFYLDDEIRHIKKTRTSVDLIDKENNFKFSKLYLAITILMSKCKFIICNSGNCSVWIILYRGNGNNVQQFLERKWI